MTPHHSNTFLSRTLSILLDGGRTVRTPDAHGGTPYGGVRCTVRYRPVPSGVDFPHTVRDEQALESRSASFKAVRYSVKLLGVRCVHCQNHLESKGRSKRALDGGKGGDDKEIDRKSDVTPHL